MRGAKTVATAMGAVEFLDSMAPHALGFGEVAIQVLVGFQILVEESDQAVFGCELRAELVDVLQVPPRSGDLGDDQFFFVRNWLVGAIEVIAHPVELETRGGVPFRLNHCCCLRRHEFVSFRLQHSRRDGDFVLHGLEVIEGRRDVGCEHPSAGEGSSSGLAASSPLKPSAGSFLQRGEGAGPAHRSR